MVRDVGSVLIAFDLCNCDFILQANSVNVVRSAGSCVGLLKPYKPLRRSPCCIVLAVIVASLSRPSMLKRSVIALLSSRLEVGGLQ